MKDDNTTDSHYLTYTFLFRKVRRMLFLNLGVKGLIAAHVARKGLSVLLFGTELHPNVSQSCVQHCLLGEFL